MHSGLKHAAIVQRRRADGYLLLPCATMWSNEQLMHEEVTGVWRKE
jgi:hypothetical protein